MTTQLLNRIALGAATAGLAIATVLTMSHASGIPVPCGGGNGCEIVAHDPGSKFLGIPVSLFGVAAYLLLVGLAALRLTPHFRRPALLGGLALSVIGVAMSSWLTFHSVFVIQAICPWCIASGTMMLLSLLTHVAMLPSRESQADAHPLSAFRWVAMPIVGVAMIAAFGSRTKLSEATFSPIDLTLVNFHDTVETSHSLGKVTAPITIAEFGDLLCPACRVMHERLLKFRQRYPSKVRLVFHHFPLTNVPGHQSSRLAAEMSERLTDSDFWKFVNTVYGKEEKPSSSELSAMLEDYRGNWARTEAQASVRIDKAIALGKKYGIKTTPTYIIFLNEKPRASATSTNLAETLSNRDFAPLFASTPQVVADNRFTH